MPRPMAKRTSASFAACSGSCTSNISAIDDPIFARREAPNNECRKPHSNRFISDETSGPLNEG
jgi:hypothetical protein